MATGIEATRRIDAHPGDVVLVTGAGPVGLGAVGELVARGVENIVVSDPSAIRRDIALRYGARTVCDPTTEDPFQLCRAMIAPGSRLGVIEASGARGILDTIMREAPPYTIVAVVGASALGETIYPMGATTSNVTLMFVTGPAFGESRYEAPHRAHELIRDGQFDPRIMVTAYTGLAGVEEALRALRPREGSPTSVKILILPSLATDQLLTPAEFRAATEVNVQ
ncbi:zinc-binding dehydrogenase [Microbacterium sp. AGC85]